MEADFMEPLERLAGKKVSGEWSVVNRLFIAHLYIHVIALATMMLCGCANQSTGKMLPEKMPWFNAEGLRLQNKNGFFVKDDKPFTGIVYALVPNKKDTMLVEAFANGQEDGEWRKYFSNGQLMERRFFTAGKKTGTYTAWWPNGKQRLLYHFAGGEYEGSCRDWDESGLLISDMHYSKGYESGPQQQFYENGKIKANYVMKNGRRYGLLGTKNCVNVSESIFKK